MKLLLDTHIWIWSVSRPSRLKRVVERALANPRNELWISPVSVWEVVTLTEKGRLKGIHDGLAWIDKALEALPFRDAALTLDVVGDAGRIRFDHRDPADRLIVATARVYECTLLTEDEAIIASKLVDVMSNR